MLLTNDGYTIIRKYFGTLSQSQVDGIELIVSKANDYDWSYPECAYGLATAWHETATKMQPVTEYGSDAYLRGLRYYPYIGRGLVQITWEANYKKFGDLLKVDLVNNPNKALDEDISLNIMFEGMTKGLFTGLGYNRLKIGRYDRQSYIKARRIINGTDQAEKIADAAMAFERALRSF